MPAAILLAFIVVRVAAVQAFAARNIGKAAAIWPGHPTVLLESGLAEVGEMAAAGRPVDKALVNRLVSASAKAPLAPEPFLVRGVEADLAGDQPLALRAFLAARQRNPRAIAPRYFLADHYLKAGRTGPGLTEISALARLVPQSLPKVAPFLAAYAKTPSAAPQVKAMLEAHPQLELALLNELAGDADNSGLVLDLWSGRGGEEAKPWQGRLLNGLIEAGRFYEARTAWARFTGISAERDRIFDTEFSAQALPPFGWKLASGPSGIAEPQGGGRLHALFYGRDDLVLASQLLILAPGRYQLSMEVKAGSPPPKSLAWTMRCLPASNQIAS
ncbi:MAG TPA: hypothetical protein VEB39_02505, partial [Sphingomicrobium sp.]|nr:hypothetical protein [Sphingomicrobium sp.]